MAEKTLISNIYEYNIELSFINEKTNKSVSFMKEQIKSIFIERNYDKYIMPMVIANLAVDIRDIDTLVNNYKNITFLLKIYKYVKNYTPVIKDKIIECKCVYFMDMDVGYTNDIIYGKEDENSDKYKTINIGLLPLDIINANKALALGTSISGTPSDIVKFYTKKLKMIMEPFDFNKEYKKQLVQSVNSISELISYLNSLSVLYKTSYRFFMDFDKTYLVSSANKAVPGAGENMTAVIIVVDDTNTGVSDKVEGMITNKDQKNYQINVQSVYTTIKKNQNMEKEYTSLSGVDTLGDNVDKDLSVNKTNYSSDKKNISRIANNNTNLINNIKSDIDSASVVFYMSKIGLDTSVLNINKRYTIKNYDAHKDVDGDFLLSRKLDMFVNHGGIFRLETAMTFRIKSK